MPEASPKAVTDMPSHFEAGERMRAFAQRLRTNRNEAKAFREKTGVFDKSGELTPAYR